jgi:DUF4097 and DUF4098 domain-containing protein YvlB
MVPGAVITVAMLVPLLADDAQVTRDGALWVRTESGVTPAAPMVKLTTHGTIVIRGGSGDQIQYKLIERVRERDEATARRMIGSNTVGLKSSGRTLNMVIAPTLNPKVMTELQVTVPRGVAELTIDTQSGDIEADDLECNLNADTTVGRIRCDRIRGFIDSKTGGGEIHIGKAGGAVRCVSAAGSISVDSTGGEAMCQTASGEIQVREAAGPLTLSTDGGNIWVDRAASGIEAHTGQGVIEIGQAGGMVVADTRGGSIQVGQARGVKCQSAAGAIRVKTLSGPLNLQTMTGSILAELLAGARIENATLVAGSGDITVMIPSNLALSLVARNDSGMSPRIVSDFSELRPKTPMAKPQLVYEGSINGGGPLMTINTGSGIIYVRKLK